MLVASMRPAAELFSLASADASDVTVLVVVAVTFSVSSACTLMLSWVATSVEPSA